MAFHAPNEAKSNTQDAVDPLVCAIATKNALWSHVNSNASAMSDEEIDYFVRLGMHSVIGVEAGSVAGIAAALDDLESDLNEILGTEGNEHVFALLSAARRGLRQLAT